MVQAGHSTIWRTDKGMSKEGTMGLMVWRKSASIPPASLAQKEFLRTKVTD